MQQKAIFYGASEMGNQAYHYLKNKYKISYYCDSDKQKWGKTLNNIKILSPDELGHMKDYIIVITSSYSKEIVKHLSFLGIDEYALFNLQDRSLHFHKKIKFNLYNKLRLRKLIDSKKGFHQIGYKGIHFNFYLPNTSEYIQNKILVNCAFYEMEVLKFIESLRLNGSIFIDVGANIGNHTLFFIKACKAKKVLSFEPNKYVLDILKTNIAINHLANKVVVYNKALGSNKGCGDLSLKDLNNHGTGEIRLNANGEIAIDTLDNILKKEKGRIGLIKIDVEGMDLEVLQGAVNTINLFKPVICIEALTPKRLEEITKFLKPGYEIVKKYSDTYIFRWRDK
ncbi:MAG TPA: hypothetical protein DD789_04855 [Firmicutes bacterium]|jgi:FkbM family methyltransferase|nr:hypothetical protein [Bacillota bacterium]